MNNPRQHRHSFFWPILLVGVGLIWLLVNLGIIAPVSIGMVLQFWPVLLIVLGLDILFSRTYAWVGSLIGILAVGGLVAFLILQPNTGTVTQTTGQTITENFTAPSANTSTVTYNLETASEPVNIKALPANSTKLIDATITHQGVIDFAVTGTANKMVTLSETTDPSNWFNWTLSGIQTKWDLGLAGGIPTDISLNGGSGSINADLTGVQLGTMTADLGSGSSSFTLPQSAEKMTFDVNSGSGSVNIVLPAKTNLTLRVQSGSGSLNIKVPANVEIQVVVLNTGSGSLSLPTGLPRISGEGDTGTWQSAGFDQAAEKIVIKIIDQGSGSISIH